MSSASFSTLTTTANTIIGSSNSNSHQVNGQLTVYNNLNLNNGNLTQTGSSTNTLSAPTIFNGQLTINNGISNNTIQIGSLNISYGYRMNISTANYLQISLPATNQTIFFGVILKSMETLLFIIQ
jgi:hypothetical protein